MKEAVVNELSFLKSPNFELPAADDLEAAKPLMKNFVVCASEGFRLGNISALRMSESFHAVELAAGYPIAIWMTDKSVDRDDRVRFIRFATSSPYVYGDLEETTFGNCIARGLGHHQSFYCRQLRFGRGLENAVNLGNGTPSIRRRDDERDR